MSVTQAMRNKTASTGKSKSKAAKPQAGKAAGDGKAMRFDPANPWPIGTIIKFTGGGTAKFIEIIHHGGGFIVLEWMEGRTPDDLDTYSFEAWDDDMAHLVESVEFPTAPAGSMLEHGKRSISSGKLDPDAAKPPHGELVWDEGFGKDEWEAASIAYAATEGGLTWRIRPSGKRKSKGWSLYASDSELIEALPSSMIGPYSELETAKTICQDLDFKAWQEEAEEAAVLSPSSPAAGVQEQPPRVQEQGPGLQDQAGNPQSSPHRKPQAGGESLPNPQSAIRNPQSKRPPRAEMAWVPIDRIDVSHNVRLAMNEATLFELQESMADVGQLEPVLVIKLPAAAKGKGAAEGFGFRMVAGHQRIEAARRAGETDIEAKVYYGDGVDDRWEAKARAAENLIRCGLNHVELARLFGDDADKGLSVAEIAAIHHVSDDSVRRHLALRRLCPPVAMLAASGRLPLHQAELISRVGDPARQIALAEHATRLSWEPGKKGEAPKWLSERRTIWKGGKHVKVGGGDEQPVQDRDFIMPMEQLRGQVASAMQGLAACGWPMGEDYAGKRRCFGCPDNTLTHADQPKLFEGIEPQGSAKKGHCTNGPCYEAKKAAWEKVVVQRRKEKERDQKKAVDRARAAGLAVCGAEGCARVLPAGEKLVVVDGVGMCGNCARMAKKREASGRGGGGGETYQARDKRVTALEKQFPWTPEQKLASALHKHGQDVAELIAEAIADGTAGSDGNCANVASMVLWAQGVDGYGSDAPKARPTVEQVTGPGIPDADLAEWWRLSASWAECSDEPGVSYDGKVKNVPLPAKHIELIADLEKIAAACGAVVPPMLTPQEIADAETRKAVLTAGREDLPGVLKAITHGDVTILQRILSDAEAGTLKPAMAKWRDAAILACVGTIRGFHGDPRPFGRAAKKGGSQEPVAGSREKQKEPGPGSPPHRLPATGDRLPTKPVKGTCRVCGCTEDTPCDGGCGWVDGSKQTLCSACFDKSSFAEIVMGIKLAAIPSINGCQDIRVLEAAQGYGLAGDWRQAAVAKRIRQIKEDADAAAEREALASEGDAAGFFCTRDCHGCPMNCAAPGDFHERMRNTIRTGKKPEAMPAIERCADVEFLEEAKRKGLTGDWRRAAVAKRIDALKCETCDRQECDGGDTCPDDEGEEDDA